jgi:hypothetical protein
VTEEPFLAGHVHHHRARTGREDHGVGGDARFVIVREPRAKRTSVGVENLHLVDAKVGPEAQGLGAHVRHQLRAGDGFGEAGIVLDVGREHQLSAGLIGRGGWLAFDDDGVELSARTVDGGREAGRSRADDQDTSVFGHYFLRLTGRRLRQIISPASSESAPTET